MARSFEQPNGPCFPIPPAGVNRQNPLATLCRQRLPFLFCSAAVCGIAISGGSRGIRNLAGWSYRAPRRFRDVGLPPLGSSPCASSGPSTCGRVKNPRQRGLPDGSGPPVCRRRRAELWPANRVFSPAQTQAFKSGFHSFVWINSSSRRAFFFVSNVCVLRQITGMMGCCEAP